MSHSHCILLEKCHFKPGFEPLPPTDRQRFKKKDLKSIFVSGKTRTWNLPHAKGTRTPCATRFLTMDFKNYLIINHNVSVSNIQAFRGKRTDCHRNFQFSDQKHKYFCFLSFNLDFSCFCDL